MTVLANPDVYGTKGALQLLDGEAALLALIASKGEKGIDSGDKRLNDRWEVLASLGRFGLINRTSVKEGYRWASYVVLTDDGRATYENTRKALWTYSTCPACVRLACVCRYSLGCLLTEDERQPNHTTTGCHGSHD